MLNVKMFPDCMQINTSEAAATTTNRARVGNKYNLIALRFEIELLRTLYHHEVVVDLNGFDLDFVDNSLNYQGPAK